MSVVSAREDVSSVTGASPIGERTSSRSLWSDASCRTGASAHAGCFAVGSFVTGEGQRVRSRKPDGSGAAAPGQP